MITLEVIMAIQRPMYGSDKPQTVTLSQLQSDGYQLLQYNTDTQSTMDYAGLPEEYQPDICGVVVKFTEDGADYDEIWFTESGAYYDLGAWYHNLAYYVTE